jgi:hypothetical protein
MYFCKKNLYHLVVQNGCILCRCLHLRAPSALQNQSCVKSIFCPCFRTAAIHIDIAQNYFLPCGQKAFTFCISVNANSPKPLARIIQYFLYIILCAPAERETRGGNSLHGKQMNKPPTLFSSKKTITIPAVIYRQLFSQFGAFRFISVIN